MPPCPSTSRTSKPLNVIPGFSGGRRVSIGTLALSVCGASSVASDAPSPPARQRGQSPASAGSSSPDAKTYPHREHVLGSLTASPPLGFYPRERNRLRDVPKNS